MDLDPLIGDIYDCAANPELWPETLGRVRDSGDFAYVMVGYMDASLPAEGINNVKHSEWDPAWVQRLQQHVPTIPHLERLFQQGIDVPWLQMDHLAEADFQQSDFYRNWVKPQKLRDGMNTLFINRQSTQGVMVMTRYEGKPLLGERERQIANALSPHVRRVIAINDMVDKASLALTLHRQVLDALSVAVFIVGTGGKLNFANAKAEALLSGGDLLRLAGGKVVATRTDIAGAKLEDAIVRARKGDKALGIFGIGVPLIGKSGERAAAYVLPIAGGDLRGQLGRGYAAVFLARRGEQQPMAIEILRTVFDLTPIIYNWNSTTHAFTVPVLLVDGADSGMTDLHAGAISIDLATSSANLVFTVHDPANPPDEIITVSPVANGSGGLAGVWTGPYPRDVTIFLPNDTFMSTITSLNLTLTAGNSPNHNGLEDACYTAAGGILSFTTAGCIVQASDNLAAINANGNAGWMNNAGSQPSWAYTVSGNTLTMVNNANSAVTVTLTRVP